MNVLILAGGTLGHISPAVYFIEEIKKSNQDVNIYFIATTKDEKYKILHSKYIYKNIYLEAYGLSKNVKKNIINYKCFKQIKKIIKQNNIDIVFGFGGYISGIGMLAAKLLKCNTYIHEQNSVMGKANRFIAKYVDKVFLTYPLINTKLSNAVLTANPVYLKARQIKKNIYKEKNTILFTSGTLGAKTINDLAVSFLNHEYSKNFKVIIVTGKSYYIDIKNKLKNKNNVLILEFSNNLIELIAASEIIVSRAGSSTLYEIMGAKGVPIIIPSPNVTDNHQYHNAMYFKSLNVASLILEEELNLETFLKTLKDIKNNYQEHLNNIENLQFNSSYLDMIKESMYGNYE